MARFTTQKINNDSEGGSILASHRQAKGLSIEKVSRTTGINQRYLQALEQGRWYDLPFGSYGKMFFKKYSQFLGLDQDGLKADSMVSSPVFSKSTGSFGRLGKLDSSWQKRRLSLWFVIGASVLIYLLMAAWLSIVPPKLSLVEPVDDITTNQPTVQVKGNTRPGTLVFVNSQSLAVGEDGLFAAEVPLQPGLNTLTVEAQKNYGRKVSLTRRVMFKPEAEVGLPLQLF